MLKGIKKYTKCELELDNDSCNKRLFEAEMLC